MCIRDRCEPAQDLLFGRYAWDHNSRCWYAEFHPVLFQERQDLRILNLCLSRYIPVSYTHLDVYKRQETDRLYMPATSVMESRFQMHITEIRFVS